MFIHRFYNTLSHKDSVLIVRKYLQHILKKKLSSCKKYCPFFYSFCDYKKHRFSRDKEYSFIDSLSRNFIRLNNILKLQNYRILQKKNENFHWRIYIWIGQVKHKALKGLVDSTSYNYNFDRTNKPTQARKYDKWGVTKPSILCRYKHCFLHHKLFREYYKLGNLI